MLVFLTEATGQTLVHSHVRNVGPDTVVVTFFADGAVKNAIDQNTDALNASGSLGLSVATSGYDMTLLMKVAADRKPMRSNFGSTLLAPMVGTGVGINAALIDIRLPDAFTRLGLRGNRESRFSAPTRWISRMDLHTYASLSSSSWFVGDTAAQRRYGAADSVIGVATVGLGLLAYHDFLNQTIGDGNEVSMGWEAGFAYRQIFGDLARSAYDSLKLDLLGTPGEAVYGLEAGLYLQVNRVKAGATYYLFPDPRGHDVNGVTDGQVVIAISARKSAGTCRPAR
jgi:hypothetical protein